MSRLEDTAERIHTAFETRTAARDRALAQARTLTRHCANAIRAIHRNEVQTTSQHLLEAGKIVEDLRNELVNFPDLYFAGYTQDALKEYAEANLTNALINNLPLPDPEELNLEPSTYLQGLAESVGELRRCCLDVLLNGKSNEAVRLLEQMDDIYAILVTMDYPDAITGGLRRLTDVARSIIERTRGDLTISLRQERLENSLHNFEARLDHTEQL